MFDFFLPFLNTYGIIIIWIKIFIILTIMTLRMVGDMFILCSTISYGVQSIESRFFRMASMGKSS